MYYLCMVNSKTVKGFSDFVGKDALKRAFIKKIIGDEFGLYGHSYGHHDDRKATSDRTVSDRATGNFPCGFIGLGAAVWLVENYEV